MQSNVSTFSHILETFYVFFEKQRQYDFDEEYR